MYFHLSDLIKRKQWLGIVLAFSPAILLVLYIFCLGYDFFSFASILEYNNKVVESREIKKVNFIDGRYVSDATNTIKFTEEEIDDSGYLFDLILSSSEDSLVIARYSEKIFTDTLGYAKVVNNCCIDVFDEQFHVSGLSTIFTAYKVDSAYELRFYDGSVVELDRIPNYKESIGVSNIAEFDITDTNSVQVSNLPLDGLYVDLNTNTLVTNVIDDFGLNFLIGSKAPVVLFASALLIVSLSWYGRLYNLDALTNKWALAINLTAVGVLCFLSIIIYYWTRIS